jgi:DNA-damage-inducible protein J
MLLHQIVLRGGIPFEVCVPNKATVKAIEELDEGKGEVFSESTHEVFGKILKGN